MSSSLITYDPRVKSQFGDTPNLENSNGEWQNALSLPNGKWMIGKGLFLLLLFWLKHATPQGFKGIGKKFENETMTFFKIHEVNSSEELVL